MARKRRIGLQQVRALKLGEIIWDASLPGFGIRRQRSEAVYYVLAYRTKQGRQRWFTIGRHGAPWTPDLARDEATVLLGKVAGGHDPMADKQAGAKALRVSALCDLYMHESAAGRLLTGKGTPKKASTRASDASRIELHIKPLLGQAKVAAVTKTDVDAFLHAVAEGRTGARGRQGSASRTVNLLSAIFSFATARRMRLDNPCRGVRRFQDGHRDRRLADEEFSALGAALREASSVWPPVVSAVRFLAITGWRSGEATALRFRDVDLIRRVAVLPDTKTGRSARVLSRAARDLLGDLAHTGGDRDALVFPSIKSSRMSGGSFRKAWNRIMKLGGLPADVTPHVLRHTFASIAADLGFSELVIAGLLGHVKATTTSKYTHQADAVLLAAADAVAARTAELMGDKGDATILPFAAAAS
jgi:integrase